MLYNAVPTNKVDYFLTCDFAFPTGVCTSFLLCLFVEQQYPMTNNYNSKRAANACFAGSTKQKPNYDMHVMMLPALLAHDAIRPSVLGDHTI